MRKGWLAVGWLVLAAVSFQSCATSRGVVPKGARDESLEELRRELDRVLADSLFVPAQVAIKVVSLATGRVWYERNSHLLLHPASNMKLLTSSTALTRLGLDFTFPTLLLTERASVAKDSLWGNLYLKGFGNPDLTTDDLRSLARELAGRGLRTIRGDLVADDSYFDDRRLGIGWMWDDGAEGWAARLSALSVNDNCVRIFTLPGDHPGESVRVRVEPPTSYVALYNTATTSHADSAMTLQVDRLWQLQSNLITVTGQMPAGHGEEEFIVNVEEPPLYAAVLLYELLKQEGITLTGHIRRGVSPLLADTLAVHRSPPLPVVVRNLNKVSDNLSAELILKTLGAQFIGTPGTAERGVHVVKQFLREIGLDTTSFRMVDGSGVSLYNLVSADLLVGLLKAMDRQERVKPEFITSLPIAGVDGTLKNRMIGTPAQGVLRAKTGSLEGVSTLSGYVTTADGEPLAFSILVQHFLGTTKPYRAVQDRIGALLAGFHWTKK